MSEPKKPISTSMRLGWVSFFNDCSSEVIARALPLLLITSLGMTPTFVGVVEGMAEAVSILLKGFSGWLSDKMASRKPLVVFGYSFSVLSRIFLLAAHVPFLFALARISDRVGKGMRTAPRDAMVADATKSGLNGRAFGILRFLDTLGAVTGIAVVLVLGIGEGPMTPEVFRQCLIIAIPFGLIALLLLIFTIPTIPRATSAKTYLAWQIPKEIRGYLLALGIFALGNSSDAFLVLRAHELGISFRNILILLAAFNLLAAFLAVPVGYLTDRIGRIHLLVLGWLLYAGVYMSIGHVSTASGFAVTVLVYGAFYGFTDGTEKALLADLLPPDKRGTGFGAMQLILGLAALPASFLTGWLMTSFGSDVAFYTASGFALTGTGCLLLWWQKGGAGKVFINKSA